MALSRDERQRVSVGPRSSNHPEDDEEEEEDSTEVYLSVLVHHGQVGLSFYDSKDCTLQYMSDTADDHNLKLLDRVVYEVSPTVLITSAKQDHSMTQFIKALETNSYNKPEIVLYPNADFGVEAAKQRLLSAHMPFIPSSITERERMPYLSSCLPFGSTLMVRSVGALLKCLERRRVGVELEDSSVGVPILQFRPYTLKDIVFVDKDTYSVLQIFKLELHPSVYKLQSGEKEGLSLYGILNRCKCKFGSRLLRQWLMRPTRDMSVLTRRQEVVRFFTSPRNVDVLSTLQGCLRNIQSIPTLLHRMTLSHTKVSDWHCLYKTVYSAVCIRDTVRSLPRTIRLFQEISVSFTEDLYHIASLISKVVDFESSSAENRFTVKSNVDPTIDEKKRTMMGLSDFLTEVARKELDNLDSRIPSCSVIYIPLIGFLLSVPRLPSMVEKEDFEIEGLDFMFLSEERLHYRSARTKELDNMLGDLHCDIRDMETAVMTQLQATVLQHSDCLLKVLQLSAELDCLMALAQASQEYNYCSPFLSPHSRLSLIQARHPLVELCTPMFVSNPLSSCEREGKVKVLTGPNSSGKSVYLKQAKHHNQIHNYTLTMAFALNHSTGNSLVLIDEFGKGTNTVDGLSLLASCLSFWLMKPPSHCPHVLVATNFHSLLQLGLLPPSTQLSPLTLETAVDGEELVFLYQLRLGICQSSYAANIAVLAGLPHTVIQRGLEVSELYRTGLAVKRIDRPSTEEQAKRYLRVVEQFLSLDLEDPAVELQLFMQELLSSAGNA
ncbi:mutS protein homolog 5 isoform X2 [Scleropages formosus]|uniref:mutS protein homolog 5 isoform X2 n=1 Tax=Scleropages formosus TaxID=113540 RepID=UPI0010FA6F0D|nr:mutS protein homolog 5 isoform X2 [Scleropages formosus]